MLQRSGEEWKTCRFVKGIVKGKEEEAATRMLCKQYDADEVEDLQMSISPISVSASPFYIPAHVLRTRHWGRKLHTFVSGTAPP